MYTVMQENGHSFPVYQVAAPTASGMDQPRGPFSAVVGNSGFQTAVYGAEFFAQPTMGEAAPQQVCGAQFFAAQPVMGGNEAAAPQAPQVVQMVPAQYFQGQTFQPAMAQSFQPAIFYTPEKIEQPGEVRGWADLSEDTTSAEGSAAEGAPCAGPVAAGAAVERRSTGCESRSSMSSTPEAKLEIQEPLQSSTNPRRSRRGGKGGKKSTQVAAKQPCRGSQSIPACCLALKGARFLRCPMDLAQNESLCNEVVAMLERHVGAEQLLPWLLEDSLQLSLASRSSCRLVQTLLEELGGRDRDALMERLTSGTLQLYGSPHGNYVLTRLIEVAPRPALPPIIERLEQLGGRAVARHRFGCRVLERLIEHSTEAQMASLVSQCVECSEELSRHQFGNFVVQSLLEHGSPELRAAALRGLVATAPQLSMHRIATHVMQKALNHGSDADRQALVESLLRAQSPSSVVEVAASRYGCYVVSELRNVFGTDGPCREVQRRLYEALPVHRGTPWFDRVAVRYELMRPEEAAEVEAAADADDAE